MANTPADVMKMAKEAGVKIVDFRFVDLLGTWQHTSKSDRRRRRGHLRGRRRLRRLVDPRLPGHQRIRHADDAGSGHRPDRPLHRRSRRCTSSATSTIRSPASATRRDPRGVAQRAEAYLKATGIGDTAYFGPEPEFFVFDNVQLRPHQQQQSSTRSIRSRGSGTPARDEGPNLGYKIRPKAGYYPVPPHDTLMDIRSEMVLTMEELGIPVEIHHHEVGTAGQCEIDMRFDTLIKMGDNVQTYKYVVRNTAQQARQGRHLHAEADLRRQRLRHARPPVDLEGRQEPDVRPRTATPGSSEFAMHYIGGLLKHGPALLAFAAPTVNSYRRLVPGLRGAGQPGLLAARTARPRSASRPTPSSEKSKRIEFRCPDTAANPYLLFAALLMAGLDGVKNKIDPGAPADFDLYEASAEELAQDQEHAGLAARGAGGARGGPRVPARGRGLHRAT